jgi:hypothetical protein
MTKSEIDYHIDNYKAVDETSDQFKALSAAEQAQWKFCGIWFILSPILKFLAGNLLIKIFKPKWIGFINTALGTVDVVCNIENS